MLGSMFLQGFSSLRSHLHSLSIRLGKKGMVCRWVNSVYGLKAQVMESVNENLKV